MKCSLTVTSAFLFMKPAIRTARTTVEKPLRLTPDRRERRCRERRARGRERWADFRGCDTKWNQRTTGVCCFGSYDASIAARICSSSPPSTRLLQSAALPKPARVRNSSIEQPAMARRFRALGVSPSFGMATPFAASIFSVSLIVAAFSQARCTCEYDTIPASST